MSAGRAVVRLWIVGSLAWIAFWTWNYTSHCMRMDDDSLWCPTLVGNAISRTDRLHMAYALFGPSVVTFVAGLFCYWAVKTSQQYLTPK